MDQPVTIIYPDINANSFEVNGIVYTATDGLSVGRGRILDRFLTEAMFGMNMSEYAKSLDALKLALNKLDFVEAATLVSRFREEVNMVGANRLRAVEIVGLWMNSPAENPAVYDYAQQQAKIYGEWASVSRDFFLAKSIHFWNAAASRYSPTEPEQAADPLPQP